MWLKNVIGLLILRMVKLFRHYNKYFFSNVVSFLGIILSIYLAIVSCEIDNNYVSKKKYDLVLSGYINKVEKNIDKKVAKEMLNYIRKTAESKNALLIIRKFDQTKLCSFNEGDNNTITNLEISQFSDRVNNCDIIIEIHSNSPEIGDVFICLQNFFNKYRIGFKELEKSEKSSELLLGGKFTKIMKYIIVILCLLLLLTCNYLWYFVRRKEIYIKYIFGFSSDEIFKHNLICFFIRIIFIILLMVVVFKCFLINVNYQTKELIAFFIIMIITNCVLNYLFSYRAINWKNL